MLIDALEAEAFATNCYVVASESGSECVVIDPGIGVEPRLEDLLRRRERRPAAVLLTHGHPDHAFAAAALSRTHGVSVFVHPADADQLSDPTKALTPDMAALARQLPWSQPADVSQLHDGEVLRVAGLEITVTHAPGHTPGSVLFRLPGDDAADSYCFTGDVLFAGSIGRTDFPGGSADEMSATVRDKLLTLPGETAVLPGHGPRTTIATERDSNPFLRQVRELGHIEAPTRGM